MKSKVLIVVETPFQLLCAYEYSRKNPAAISLYVRNSGVGSNDQQMSAMVRDLKLQVKKEFLVRPGNKIDYFLSVLGFLFSGFHRYDKVVLGSFFWLSENAFFYCPKKGSDSVRRWCGDFIG